MVNIFDKRALHVNLNGIDLHRLMRGLHLLWMQEHASGHKHGAAGTYELREQLGRELDLNELANTLGVSQAER